MECENRADKTYETTGHLISVWLVRGQNFMFQWSTYLLVKLFQFWDSLNLFIFLFRKSQKPSTDVIYPDNNFELAWKHAYAKFLSHFVKFTYENCFKFGTQRNCFGQHKFEGKLCIEWQFVMTNKFFFSCLLLSNHAWKQTLSINFHQPVFQSVIFYSEFVHNFVFVCENFIIQTN